MQSTWTALFVDEAAKPYWNAIDAIVNALDENNSRGIDWGKPLLHAYLAETRAFSRHRQRAEELVEGALDTLEQDPLAPALYGGVAGIAWLSSHAARLWRISDESAYDEVDQLLLDVIRTPSTPLLYDLIGGSVGLGVYFLERLPSPRAAEALQHIVRVLADRAEWQGDEVTWHTAGSLVPNSQRNFAPDGYYNVGVAHGVPGIIGLLGGIRRAGILNADVERLLPSAIRWVLSHQTRDGLLPAWIVNGKESSRSRVAWCYGELGVSVALVLASEAIANDDSKQRALDLASRSAARLDHGAIDAGLCHGCAGNGHLFNRLYQATRRDDFRNMAIEWFGRALKMRKDDVGVGGFQAWQPRAQTEGAQTPWVNDSSFLTGASGIALAFLAAITTVEPTWDDVMLCRLEPRSAIGG